MGQLVTQCCHFTGRGVTAGGAASCLLARFRAGGSLGLCPVTEAVVKCRYLTGLGVTAGGAVSCLLACLRAGGNLGLCPFAEAVVQCCHFTGLGLTAGTASCLLACFRAGRLLGLFPFTEAVTGCFQGHLLQGGLRGTRFICKELLALAASPVFLVAVRGASCFLSRRMGQRMTGCFQGYLLQGGFSGTIFVRKQLLTAVADPVRLVTVLCAGRRLLLGLDKVMGMGNLVAYRQLRIIHIEVTSRLRGVLIADDEVQLIHTFILRKLLRGQGNLKLHPAVCLLHLLIGRNDISTICATTGDHKDAHFVGRVVCCLYPCLHGVVHVEPQRGLIGIFQTVLHALMGISLAIDYLNRVSGGDICTEIAVTGSTFVYDPFNAFTLCSGILRPAGLIAKLKAGVRQLCGIYNGYLAGCGLAAIHRGGSDDCAADTARVNTTVIHISYIGIAAAPDNILIGCLRRQHFCGDIKAILKVYRLLGRVDLHGFYGDDIISAHMNRAFCLYIGIVLNENRDLGVADPLAGDTTVINDRQLLFIYPPLQRHIHIGNGIQKCIQLRLAADLQGQLGLIQCELLGYGIDDRIADLDLIEHKAADISGVTAL